MTRYVRRRLSRGDGLAAAAVSLAVAAGVGVVTFYVTRIFLSREPVGSGDDGDLLEPAPERPGIGAGDR